jgi:4-hydroxybenzoate polyprenyltransferase
MKVWFELGRISNLPTVWSNIVAGWVLAGGSLDWRLTPLLFGGSLLYTAGMFLNDAFDAQWDREHRPERPIPSGRASSAAVWLWGWGMLVAGAVLMAWPLIGATPASFYLEADDDRKIIARLTIERSHHGLWSGLVPLVAAIVLYDWLHKKTWAAVVLMALCRFFLIGVGAMAAAPLALAGSAGQWAALVAFYVLGITVLARHESVSQRPSIFGAIAVAAAPLGACLIFPLDGRWWLFFLIFALGWIAFGLRILSRRSDAARVGRSVSHFLAGLVVMDALAISFFRLEVGAAIFALLPVTLWLQRHVPAT